MRQVFHVATSPIVASAWAEGQELHLVGCIYDLRDGIMRKLVGPVSGNTGQSAGNMCRLIEWSWQGVASLGFWVLFPKPSIELLVVSLPAWWTFHAV